MIPERVQEARPTPAAAPGASRLSDLSGKQWKSGIAAWLGWLFDGLDMHLYTLVAASFVAALVHVPVGDPLQKRYSSWIQAAFLIGWALGGGFFGRIGDKLGRSRALSLTIITYAAFTGLSFFVTTWWELLICRFVAALGIGGEWAVGASLLSETWPKRWRPWIAAVLQSGVNIGVLLACVTVYVLKDYPERYVFLVGVLPALLVFWIRRNVPEPEEWQRAKVRAGEHEPGIADLFKGSVRRTTLLTIGVCASSLTGWWAFMFWHTQHLRSLPELSAWTEPEKRGLMSQAFFLIIAISIIGNFFAGWMARLFGYRRTITMMFAGFFLAFVCAYGVPRDHNALLCWLPVIGFFSGVFGLFTMYMPPLFPTLLRTTGAGFCYNIGRIAAAVGTVVFGIFATVRDFRLTLLAVGFVFIPACVIAMFLPDLSKEEGGTD